VVNGNNGDANEKSGELVLLAFDRKTEFARIKLHNLGICALRRRHVANDDAVKKVTAELYCERMELQVGAAVPAGKTEPRLVAPPAPVSTLRAGRTVGPIR
jgi:hypothetical protein